MNYQAKVSTRADVRALFEKVKADPSVACYRGYTESKSYGWDEAADDYIKRDGEVWFDNPSYDPKYVPEVQCDSGTAELLDEQLAQKEAELVALRAEKTEIAAETVMLHTQIAEMTEQLRVCEAERDAARKLLADLREALIVARDILGA